MNQQLDIDKVAKLLGQKDIALLQAQQEIERLKMENEALKKQVKEKQDGN